MTRLPIPWLADEPDTPFPPVASALRDPNGLLAAGGDLTPERLLNAYRHAVFPWFMPGEPILWWSPDPRCVFATAAMHVPRRLARSLRKLGWRVEADRRFETVLDACAAPRDAHGGTWITDDMREAYLALYALGHAHSIEVVDADGALVGGLYGVAIGRMFFAESMFSARDHGSKVALLALADRLADLGFPLIDAQVASSHLFTLGAQLVPRASFAPLCKRLCDEPYATLDLEPLASPAALVAKD